MAKLCSARLDARPKLLEDILLVAANCSILASVPTSRGPREKLLQEHTSRQTALSPNSTLYLRNCENHSQAGLVTCEGFQMSQIKNAILWIFSAEHKYFLKNSPESYSFVSTFPPDKSLLNITQKSCFLLGCRPWYSKYIFSHLHCVLSISGQLGKCFPENIKSDKYTDQGFNLGASITSLV